MTISARPPGTTHRNTFRTGSTSSQNRNGMRERRARRVSRVRPCVIFLLSYIHSASLARSDSGYAFLPNENIIIGRRALCCACFALTLDWRRWLLTYQGTRLCTSTHQQTVWFLLRWQCAHITAIISCSPASVGRAISQFLSSKMKWFATIVLDSILPSRAHQNHSQRFSSHFIFTLSIIFIAFPLKWLPIYYWLLIGEDFEKKKYINRCAQLHTVAQPWVATTAVGSHIDSDAQTTCLLNCQ